MDLQRLREETRAEHEATEAVMPFGRPGLTRAMYLHTLEALFGLVSSWESWAASSGLDDLVALLKRRRRSHLLLADLETLHGSVPEKSFPVDWGSVVAGGRWQPYAPGAYAALLGAIYVFEGSTLGGRFIAREVESTLGLSPGQGDAYFRGHEEQTGPLWKEVTALIVHIPDQEAGELIRAAERTFAAFRTAIALAVRIDEVRHG